MALVLLVITVLAQRPPQRDGEWDGPPAGVALRRHEHEPAGLALQGLPHPELAAVWTVVQVQVMPGHAKGLALAQAQGESDRP